MKVVTMLALLIWIVGCDTTSDESAAHLRVIGYRTVVCESDGLRRSLCIADDAKFYCVAPQGGCAGGRLACERYYLESPVPR